MIHLWDGGETSDAHAHMKMSNIMFGHNLQTNYKSPIMMVTLSVIFKGDCNKY